MAWFESNGMNGFVMRYTTFSQNNAAVYGGGFWYFQAGITS